MSTVEIRSLNGHKLVDETARQAVEQLSDKIDENSYTKETWTFTLENGSTVSKVVHVG